MTNTTAAADSQHRLHDAVNDLVMRLSTLYYDLQCSARERGLCVFCTALSPGFNAFVRAARETALPNERRLLDVYISRAIPPPHVTDEGQSGATAAPRSLR